MGKLSENKVLKPAISILVGSDGKAKFVGPDGKTKFEVNTKPMPVEPHVNDIDKYHHNLKQILQHSNATPILRCGGVGYVCSYCCYEVPKAADLKKHTLTEHPSKEDPVNTTVKGISSYTIKLDITNLECTECAKAIDRLEDLIIHLRDEHKKKFYAGLPHVFIPYKFLTDKLTCCLCPSIFDKFRALQEHMHTHYRNYNCDVCDAGFITRHTSIRHLKSHKYGEFPCSFCGKVYDTIVKKQTHEKTCNISKSMLEYPCTLCNKRFKEYHEKQIHMAVHETKPKEYKCESCDRSYDCRRKLRVHVKRDHLLERKYKCTQCDARFFGSHSVKRHMEMHMGVKNFKCDICQKSYRRKSTLNEHNMKCHSEPFKCESCNMSFIERWGWEIHCKIEHGVIVE